MFKKNIYVITDKWIKVMILNRKKKQLWYKLKGYQIKSESKKIRTH